MAADPKEQIAQRTGRTVREILTFKDEYIDPHLPPDLADRFRTLILDSVNALADEVAFIAEAAADGYIVSPAAVEMIGDLHRRIITDSHTV